MHVHSRSHNLDPHSTTRLIDQIEVAIHRLVKVLALLRMQEAHANLPTGVREQIAGAIDALPDQEREFNDGLIIQTIRLACSAMEGTWWDLDLECLKKLDPDNDD